MKSNNHHEFTLWVYAEESHYAKVPAMIFDEATSSDEILLTMLAIGQLGLYCSLTCDTWTEEFKDESEEVKND